MKITTKKTIISFCFLLLVSGVYAQSVPAFVADSLDNYINTALQQWNIPGAAVCIVKDGKIVVMKGYGVRETGSTDKVDENTLFMIGSNTKAFTATVLAALDNEKKLSLDDKATKWLPAFKMKDPWVTNEVTVRDLLCHRLGMETFQGDFMFFDTNLSSDEVLQKFSRLTPVHGFRTKWGYTNAAFLAAGIIAGNAAHSTWEDVIRTKIFQPLGMNRSLALSEEITNAGNKATAHTLNENHQLIKIPYGHLDNLAPAGSISSSVSDLSKWVTMLLDSGKYLGKQIIPFDAIQETRNANTIMEEIKALNFGHFSLYGLGWQLTDYGGKKMVSHNGGVNGFVTGITLIPEEKLGVVVLTNTDANWLYEALNREIVDAYMGFLYRNYSNVFFNYYKQQQKTEDQILQLNNRFLFQYSIFRKGRFHIHP
jgi:CubicO group peptidase (beta-lactamase class C family)